MNPLVGLQTGWTPPSNTVSWQQGMPGLMGNVLQQPSQQAGLMGGGSLPSLQGVQPGDWSSVAYNMAGRPNQGPSPTAPGLPMPPGVSANGSSSSGGGSSVGGTALGILGALAKNPALLKSAGSGVSSLWNSLTGAGAAGGSVLAGGSPALSAVGTGAVAPAVDSAAADASAALGGADAAGSGAAAAGALGAGSGAVGAAGANALAASGSFATGGGAASAGTGAAGAAPAALGTAAIVAAPFIFQQLGLMAGGAWANDKGQQQATDAMQAWEKATGATSRIINSPSASQASALAQGGFAGTGSGYQPIGVIYDANGNPMSDAQSQAAAYQWAQAHGMAPGTLLNPTAAQNIIKSGGAGSQVYSGPKSAAPKGTFGI